MPNNAIAYNNTAVFGSIIIVLSMNYITGLGRVIRSAQT